MGAGPHRLDRRDLGTRGGLRHPATLKARVSAHPLLNPWLSKNVSSVLLEVLGEFKHNVYCFVNVMFNSCVKIGVTPRLHPKKNRPEAVGGTGKTGW